MIRAYPDLANVLLPTVSVPHVRSEVTWPSIPAMLRDTAQRQGTAEAVVDGDRRVPYAELEAMVARAARALVASGLQPGERVAVWAPNSLEWIVAALGDHDGRRRAGAREHPVQGCRGRLRAVAQWRQGALHRPRLPRHRLSGPARRRRGRRSRHSRTRSSSRAPSTTRPSVPGTPSWRAATSVSADVVDERVAALGPDDPSDVVFTSGTTGSPKGVVMAHGQALRGLPRLVRLGRSAPRRPLPDREPVLPHLRLQGRACSRR